MSGGVWVDMLLICPACGDRHIDEGEFATKLHHTHACQTCGTVWRPAIVATRGVRFLPGFKNEEVAKGSPGIVWPSGQSVTVITSASEPTTIIGERAFRTQTRWPNDASPERAELNRVAEILVKTWESVEKGPLNISHVATFVDLARAMIADRKSGVSPHWVLSLFAGMGFTHPNDKGRDAYDYIKRHLEVGGFLK